MYKRAVFFGKNGFLYNQEKGKTTFLIVIGNKNKIYQGAVMKYDIERLRQVLEQKYLIPAKKSGYVCPICDNGTGKDGTGIVSKDGIHFTCFKGCFSNADIIDIVAIAENIKETIKF